MSIGSNLELVKEDSDREIIRITVAALLLAIVLSNLFWDSPKTDENSEPKTQTESDNNIEMLRGAGILTAFFFGVYLFFLTLGYLPTINLLPKNAFLSEVLTAGRFTAILYAHFFFSYAMFSVLLILGIFSLEKTFKENTAIILLAMIALFVLAYFFRKNTQKIEYRSRM